MTAKKPYPYPTPIGPDGTPIGLVCADCGKPMTWVKLDERDELHLPDEVFGCDTCRVDRWWDGGLAQPCAGCGLRMGRLTDPKTGHFACPDWPSCASEAYCPQCDEAHEPCKTHKGNLP